MGFVSRKTFTSVFTPDADPVNAPETVLLRGDNCILDERGVVGLRAGSAKINGTPLADLDVHSLFTTALSGTRYRMAGAGNNVYANGTAIATGLAGSDDIAFGFHLGQILFARSTTKKKYDGTTVRNWGIAKPSAKPTAVQNVADGKMLSTGHASETPAWVTVEGVAPTYGPVGPRTEMMQIGTAAGTFRGVYTKTWAAPLDFTTYDAATPGYDDDIVSFYFSSGALGDIWAFGIQVDVNDGTFTQDYFMSPLYDGRLTVGQDPAHRRAPSGTPTGGTGIPRVVFDQLGPIPGVGSIAFPIATGDYGAPFRITLKRSDFVRLGILTNGKGWNTVKALRFILHGNNTVTGRQYFCNIEELRINSAKLLGETQWRYVYARNASGYVAKSGPSAESTAATFNTNAATITVPADPSRDTQVNEIWLYRKDEVLETYYRVGVKTGISGTGPVTISDTLLSDDALDLNIKLELDNTTPPDNIIAIVGPHFDRTLVLTSGGTLWPSRKLDPDAFATGQAITVAGTDETVYWMLRALTDVFIGTSKDIYRLEGTGAELPDGGIDYVLRPMSIDHRPVNAGIAHEGDQVAFFSDDGWRASTGGGTQLLTGATSLLYQGKTRHGVSPVNIATGRVRAALAKGKLVAITPEGVSVSAPVLYRHVFASGHWYRHTYAQSGNFRSLYREPDGTLIAGDDAGTVWILDTGTQDDGQDIPVVLWTKVDDLGLPYQRKKIGELAWRSETGGATASLAVHLDGASAASTTPTVAPSSMSVDAIDLANNSGTHAIPICRQIQFRVTGNFPSFHLYDYGLQYRERPVPLIGRLVETATGTPGIKRISGFIVKGNTLGATLTVTAYLDGIPDSEALEMATSLEEPETHTLHFTGEARRATDISLAFSGQIEVDAWSPIITHREPVGVKVWDSGPFLDGDKELVWLRDVRFKVRAGADLVVTPYFDGVAFPTVTIAVTADVETVYRVPVGRSYVGRQPRLVVTSCEPFFPYWVRATRRSSGDASQKPKAGAPFTLDTGGGW